MTEALAFAALSVGAKLEPIRIQRRDPAPHEVSIRIEWCGVCHTDLHCVHDDWGGQPFPCVPGHEIIGRIEAVGSEVKDYKLGDMVGVGCMTDSCGECDHCLADRQQLCRKGVTWTYGKIVPDYSLPDPGCAHTLGGYSARVTVSERFLIHLPDDADMAATAPLFCAGVTTYLPMKRHNVGPGTKVGILGIGGLGHLAVKIAKAMDATVTALVLPDKKADALSLGADHVVDVTDPAQMAAASGSLELIVDAVGTDHDIRPTMSLLQYGGVFHVLGVPKSPYKVGAFDLALGDIKLTASLIGGMDLTRETLSFCLHHNIGAEVEVIKMDDINEAFQRMKRGDVRYRFVLDLRDFGA